MDNNYNPIHKPIMVEEIKNILNLKNDGVYLDATTGEGGHSEELLKTNSSIKIICNDRDKQILNRAKIRLNRFKDRIEFTNLNFAELDRKINPESLDGIIADLGISSFHYDIDNRGFSFNKNELLDMRLDNDCKYSAYDIINSFSEKDLADIIYTYGEERNSRKIAKAIVNKRKETLIKTTKELAELIFQTIPKKFHPKKIHVATKTFQSLRIFVNNELTYIEKGIEVFTKLLKSSGIMCIISFHSLEDRIIKRKFRELSAYAGNRDPYAGSDLQEPKLDIINKKPITPNENEKDLNPRSRSAKLRTAMKL